MATARRDLSSQGRQAHLCSAAEGKARLSSQAARQQVVETQPLGMGLEDGGCCRHRGTRMSRATETEVLALGENRTGLDLASQSV